jgi:hypothetical protein
VSVVERRPAASGLVSSSVEVTSSGSGRVGAMVRAQRKVDGWRHVRRIAASRLGLLAQGQDRTKGGCR